MNENGGRFQTGIYIISSTRQRMEAIQCQNQCMKMNQKSSTKKNKKKRLIKSLLTLNMKMKWGYIHRLKEMPNLMPMRQLENRPLTLKKETNSGKRTLKWSTGTDPPRMNISLKKNQKGCGDGLQTVNLTCATTVSIDIWKPKPIKLLWFMTVPFAMFRSHIRLESFGMKYPDQEVACNTNLKLIKAIELLFICQ